MKGCEEIPLFGKKKKAEKKKRRPRKQLPKCPVCVEKGIKPAKSVREDAYGRPLEECREHAIKKTQKGLREMPPFRR